MVFDNFVVVCNVEDINSFYIEDTLQGIRYKFEFGKYVGWYLP